MLFCFFSCFGCLYFILFDTLLIFFVGMLLCFLLMCVFEFVFFDGFIFAVLLVCLFELFNVFCFD